jgi:hypothetical protein
MRLEELCPQDRAACERAQEHNRADDFDTQAFNRSVRLIGRLHGPTPLMAGQPRPDDLPLGRVLRNREFADGRRARDAAAEVALAAAGEARPNNSGRHDGEANRVGDRGESAVRKRSRPVKILRDGASADSSVALRSENDEFGCFQPREQSGRYLYFILCFQYFPKN